MTDQTLSIPIDSIEKDFKDFIQPDSNKRIIFSGPFGIGKTYFLNKFFKKRTEEYLPIFLRPVNYSLLSNEDVFRLIKYDILLQLIHFEEFDFDETEDFSKIEYSEFFLKENGLLILRNLLKLIPKIQTAVDGIEKLEDILSAYKNGVEQVNQSTDLKLLLDFQNESEHNFLLEFDNVSQYISQKLDEIIEIKSNGDKPEKVLVIDDLDRLDPEHIFRLFNVFSAHFDQVQYQENGNEQHDNKFGFDKIIFVCDIENIRKIFAHKYGEGVDFSGYIDKFYSTRIYNLFHQNVFEESINPFIENQLNYINPEPRSSYFKDAFRLILNILFESKQLSIRDIIRFRQLQSTIVKEKNKYVEYIIPLTKMGGNENSYISYYNFLITLKLLIDLIGNHEILNQKLQKANENLKIERYFNQHNYRLFIEEMILYADIDNHKFHDYTILNSHIQDENNTSLSFSSPVLNKAILYTISAEYLNRREGSLGFILRTDENLPEISILQFFGLFIEASHKVFIGNILN